MPTETPTNAFALANVIIPMEGPKCAPVTLDFNGTDGTYTVDCSQIITSGKMSYIQCIYIDNADNPNKLTITCAITGQRIIAPAHMQGYYSVLAPNNPIFQLSTTTGNFKVGLSFLNVPVQPDQWSAA